jgi:glucose dehydrogenase
MKHLHRSFLVTALSGVLLTGLAAATDLETAMSDSKNWAAQAGDYANHRYSDLNQINATNVGKLQVAWTMSTGVLRGHEDRRW